MGFVRKHLSADGLIQIVRHSLLRSDLKPLIGSDYTWQDCFMSGLAIFAFKAPSLLQFEKMKSSETMIRRNLRTLYKVKKAPSDSTLRERLDRVPPKHFRLAFKKIFSYLQRSKVLESCRYLDNHYIISIDGTGQYSSKKVSCKHCCEKKHKKTGEVTYYHQMLGASLVHPDKKVVIPLAPEPIVKGDGDTKNDCERKASKRLLTDFRREHPHLKALIVEDGLASNYPHLSLIDSLNMDYIVGVKPGDHKYLFDWISDLPPNEHSQTDEAGIVHAFKYYNDVPLNDANYDYRVNVIEYTETKKSGKQRRWSWVTKLTITPANAYKIMRAARSRWKIENETFNTLKNQGYNFEHNFGHGNEYLCSVMMMLMLLAFLIDQVQQLCCKNYQKARKHIGNFKKLFEEIRVLIRYAVWDSMEQILIFIGVPESRSPPDTAMWPTS
jgi:hypothetical protein